MAVRPLRLLSISLTFCPLVTLLIKLAEEEPAPARPGSLQEQPLRSQVFPGDPCSSNYWVRAALPGELGALSLVPLSGATPGPPWELS